jgi:beta-lactamase regulating signal transducer with metallopeptidase domain
MSPNGNLEQGMEWLWRASWQASVLVLLVLAVQGVCRARLEPPWRFALWWLVLARLMIPFAPESAWSVFNLARVETFPAAFQTRQTAIEEGLANAEMNRAPALIPKTQPVVVTPKPQSIPRKASFPLIAWLWLAGVALYGGRILAGTWVLSRTLRRHAPLTDGKILGVLEDCRRAMGVKRALEVWVTDAVDSPALFGLWRCRLLVPSRMPADFTLAEWRHVFLHELAHVRRRDPQTNGLMVVLQALHWFNPLVWYAMGRMRADRELACDAAALACAPENEAQSYGQTILKLLAGLAGPGRTPSLVGILEAKNQIKLRLRRIAGFKKSRQWPILAAVMLAGLCVFAMTDAPRKATAKPAFQLSQNSTNLPAARANLNQNAGVNRDAKAANPPISGKLLAPSVEEMAEGSFAEARTISSSRKQAISHKLDSIVFQESYEIFGEALDSAKNLPLGKVLELVSLAAKRMDPEREGVNFVISSRNVEADARQNINQLETNVFFRLEPKLRKVTLRQVLAAIVARSEPKDDRKFTSLGYAIEEYGVAIFQTGNGVVLHNRIFRINPNSINIEEQDIRSFEDKTRMISADTKSGVNETPTNAVAEQANKPDRALMVQIYVRKYFTVATGIPFDQSVVTNQSVNQNGVNYLRPMFYNDKTGVLFVRATTAELNAVEHALRVLGDLDATGLSQ